MCLDQLRDPQPRSEGALAYHLDKTVDENPYRTTDPRYRQWMAGYLAHEDEEQDENE